MSGGPSITLAASPEALGVGDTRQLFATVKNDPGGGISWQVVEPNGGSVTQQGLYTAPVMAGIYHVVASLTANPSVSATAAITVQSGGVIVSVDFPATGDLPVTIK
jgi:hypothetical protein